MHRQMILDLLEQYTPSDDRDEQCRQRFVAFVRSNPDCFERSLACGHITGAAWLLDPTGCKVLLTHHRKLNCWLQVGGHADGQCDIIEVAMREAQEESGIEDICVVDPKIFDLDIHTIPAHNGLPAHEHFDVRFLLQSDSKKLVISDESHDLQWFDAQELLQMNLDESILRMRRKWLQRPVTQRSSTGTKAQRK
ncbi:MAG TPA: NUDIX hydrolase [Phycisphaerae bacterium]|nr:NUDIX hydrolase [Phycisphaerae bacterium]